MSRVKYHHVGLHCESGSRRSSQERREKNYCPIVPFSMDTRPTYSLKKVYFWSPLAKISKFGNCMCNSHTRVVRHLGGGWSTYLDSKEVRLEVGRLGRPRTWGRCTSGSRHLRSPHHHYQGTETNKVTISYQASN